ncbi:MAG: hypothetical protein K9G76_03990 [Bacteroidales bacterium]|nr:hypothetical protein [Bacteroidales bacterium]MCF8403583.1 hypothetical protein [Bacteroidales bacterium]
MMWFQWLALAAILICTISCLFHFFRLLRLGKPRDYSQQRGNIGSAVRYSFTGAMSPASKESAFLYLPTYTAGIFYHIGTFLSITVLALMLLQIFPVSAGLWVAIILGITSLSGIAIFIKRLNKKELRALSNPDDYISNMLVTLFQVFTVMILIFPDFEMAYYVTASLLFLYLPIGKLKHTVYFFAARYHLGFFFGWRGIWPPKEG